MPKIPRTPRQAREAADYNHRYYKTLGGYLAKRAFICTANAKMRGADGRITKAQLENIWFVQGGREAHGQIKQEPFCAICRIELRTMAHRGMIIDHIHRVEDGGRTEPQNLRMICWECDRRTRTETILGQNVPQEAQQSLFSD